MISRKLACLLVAADIVGRAKTLATREKRGAMMRAMRVLKGTGDHRRMPPKLEALVQRYEVDPPKEWVSQFPKA